MPTYEFRCPQGHEFEKLYRTISGAEAQAVCPQCGQIGARLMSAAGFAFKGSGFYLTDYGKNAHREKGTPEPSTSAPAGDAPAKGEQSAAPSSESSASAAPPATSGGDSAKKSEAKPAEPKPAVAPAKKSTGE
jgi:putative FmdB family regulatory protein